MKNAEHHPKSYHPSGRPAVDTAAIATQVETVLAQFLDTKSRQALGAEGEHRMPEEIIDVLREFVLAGGKRIRPVLCVLGWHAAGGSDNADTAIRVGAALEMFHAFALIHDDVMDRSDSRRGHPTVHRCLAAHHIDHPHAGRLGTAAAILIGDLALVWSDELLHTTVARPDRQAAVLSVVHAMRSELMYGQYLDLVATGRPSVNMDAAMVVARYKTARYTIERPLQVGVALAGAGTDLLRACSDYGICLGEAFQLRDDLLGVFGDPVQTGKSAIDDLRMGKHTALIALGLQRSDARQRGTLQALLGSADLDEQGAAAIRDILTVTGARAELERMITQRYRQALGALRTAGFESRATATLQQLAHAVVARIA